MFFILGFFPETEKWGKNLTTISRWIFPSFCFGDTLYKMAFRRIITTIEREEDLIDVWDSRIAG
jgi:hypothetical protein